MLKGAIDYEPVGAAQLYTETFVPNDTGALSYFDPRSGKQIIKELHP